MTDRTYRNLEITEQLKAKELFSANTRTNNISTDNMYSKNANITTLSATNYYMENAILTNLTATTLSATTINATTLTSTNMNLTNLSVTNFSTSTVTAQNIYNSSNLNVMGNTNINKTIKGFKNFYDLTQPDNIDFDIISTWFDASVPLNVTTTGINNTITRVYDRYGTGYNVTPTPVDTYFTPLVSDNISYDTNKNGIYFNGGLSYFSATTITSQAAFCFFICYEQQDKSPNESIIASIFNNENKIFYNSTNVLTTNNVNSTEIYKTYPSKLIVAINYDSGNTYNVYVNGIYSHSYSSSAGIVSKVYIGNDSTGDPNKNFKGWIYEAVLYKQALTEQQIGYITTYFNDKWNVYENRTIDIFTVAGEENALGMAYNPAVSPTAYTGLTKPDVGRYLDPIPSSLTKWKIASERFGTGRINAIGSRGSAWGAFCQEYFKQTGREAWILYVAEQNTSLFNTSQWAPSNAASNYIQQLLTVIDAAVAKINNTYLYNVGTKSIIWHQGESDRNRTKSEYTTAFLGMFDYVMNTGKYDKFFYYEICDGNTFSTENVRAAQRELYSYRSNLHLLFECSNFKAQGGLRSDTEFSYNVQSYETMGQQGAISAASYILERVNYYINTISVNKQLSFPNPSPSNPIIRFGTVTTTNIFYNQSTNELKYSSTNNNITTDIMSINPTYTTFYNNLSLSKAPIYSLQTITTDTVLNKNTLIPIYIADTNSSNVSLTLPNNFINSDTGSTFQVIKTGSNILAIRPPPIPGSNIFILNGSTNPINVTTNYQVKTITFGGISGFNNNFYLS